MHRFEVGQPIAWINSVWADENEQIHYSTLEGVIKRITPYTVVIRTNQEPPKEYRLHKWELLQDIHPDYSDLKEAIGAGIGGPPKQEDTKVYAIYALCDPATGTARYIGISKNVQSRYKQHCTCSGTNLQKNIWIQQLLQKNQQPILSVIETVRGFKAACEREKVWIHHYLDLGLPLTNWNENEQARNGGTREDFFIPEELIGR